MKKRIIVFGDGEAPQNSISYLISRGHEILIIIDPDDTGVDGWRKSLLKFCINNNLNYIKSASFNDPNFLKEIKNFKPDIIFSIQCRKILKKEIIDLVNGEIFNFHFADLPLNRGCFPGVWHILNGDKYTGVTLHKLTEGIDDGPIIDKKRKAIEIDDTAKTIYFWSVNIVRVLMKKNIDKLMSMTYVAKEQDSSKSSYFSRKSLTFKDLYVDWDKPSSRVARYIQAFIFPPYQYPKTRYKNKDLEIESVNNFSNKQRKFLPGTVVSRDKENIEIQTKNGTVSIHVRNKNNLSRGDLLYL